MSSLPQWTHGLHHDGSAVYVSNPLPTLNESVTVWLRVPKSAPVTDVFIRTTRDGEQHFVDMSIDPGRADARSVWYAGEIVMHNRLLPYRFKLMTPEGAFNYNGLGVRRSDSTDTYDFRLLADFESPEWVRSATFYQIFPDRFYNSDPALNPPEGREFHHPPQGTWYSQMREWEDVPVPFEEAGTVDYWGGDLPGIAVKLGYLQDLGVSGIYLTPIFTSSSNHRYNIDDFYNVDPHLGGNLALVALREALDAANMRLILDITPNHAGHHNGWFQIAQNDPDSDEASFFTFYRHPDHYEAWLGVAALPKLNYRSEKLRDVMFRDPDAIFRRWLRPPYRIDGWRLDVWNMTAIQGETHLQHEVGRGIRQAVKEENAEAYLFGEHFFDFTDGMMGDEMDAMMNYQGFSFPVWRWIAGHDLGSWAKTPRPYADPVPLPAEDAAEQMQTYLAAVPWAAARVQFNLLGSHDTPRMLSIVKGDVARAKLAATLLMTYPGAPSIYYGDEIGMEGWADPDNRRTMIWDETRWNTDLREHYRALIALRRESDAIQNGGMQFLHAEGPLLAYLRESQTERVIVVGYRGEAPLENASLPAWVGGIPDGATFTDLFSGVRVAVSGDNLALGTLEPGTSLVLRGET